MSPLFLAITRFGVAFALCGSCLAAEVRFDEVIRDPQRFNGKRVTFTAIAEDSGARIALWPNIRTRQRDNMNDSITAYIRPGLRPYPGTNLGPYAHANLRWVRVTGIVDMTLRGCFNAERFGLQLDRLEVLPGPRLKQFLSIVGWFRNDSAKTVQLVLSRNSSNRTGTDLGPGGLQDLIIEKGALVTVTSKGRLVGRRAMTKASTRDYYDPAKRAYYFRITDGGVNLVLPSQAKSWKFPPTPDRD